MLNEMVTDPLAVEDLWDDLRLNLAHLKALGITQVLLLFGFSWGQFFYAQGENWYDLPTGIDDVELLLERAHAKGHGALGHDNLYISIPEMDVRLQYSHETDIHLSFGEANPFVQTVLERWKQNQWFLAKQPR
jgi:hypothetical protein